MKTKSELLRPLFTLAAVAAIAIPASAGTVTFGQFNEQNGTQDFLLTQSGATETFSGSSLVDFTFFNSPSAPTGPQAATLNFDFTSTANDSASGGNLSEGDFTGTFSITLATAYQGQTNALSGTIGDSGATLSGKSAGSSGSFSDSTPPANSVVFNSSFINFSSAQSEALAFSLSSVNPAFLDNGSGKLSPFTSAGSGTFSYSPVANAPEPASMLLLGAGLIAFGGFGARRVRARRV